MISNQVFGDATPRIGPNPKRPAVKFRGCPLRVALAER
jgi:hypothetical protein